MDTASLLRKITELEGAADHIEHWLTFFIVLVVLGLMVEVYVAIREHRRAIVVFPEGVIKSPEKPTSREFFLHLSGPILITVGVAGELWAHVETGRISTDLRNANNRIVAILDLERARLQSALGPRKLTDEQKETLAAVIAKYPGIAIDVYVTDQEDDASRREAIAFAEDLATALGQGKRIIGGHNCKSWPVVGLIVETSPDNPHGNAASDIWIALKSFNIGMIPHVAPIQLPPCAMFSGGRAQPAKTVIIVGKRPSPILKVEEPRTQPLPPNTK